jgi:hypothetical protein
MATQTTYADRMATAYEGMIASTAPSSLVSYEVETEIGFGKLAAQGTASNQCEPADNAADLPLGITVRVNSTDFGASDAINVYPVKETACLLTEGEIYVTAGGTATAGTAVYMIPANGKFVTAATDNLAVPGATFVDSGVDTNLVKIRIK